MDIKVAASIMAGNFTQEAVDKAKSADFIHIDIMDGEFVENKTIWADYVSDLETSLPKETHLMINNPEEYIDEFVNAGVEMISFHTEATEVPESVIGQIHAAGVKAGIAINPETDLKKIMPLIEEIDYVLIMSVHPGKGGQEFIEKSLQKVIVIRDKFPNLDIEIDGGINKETAKKAIDAGVNILISGSYLYSGNIEKNIRELRKPS